MIQALVLQVRWRLQVLWVSISTSLPPITSHLRENLPITLHLRDKQPITLHLQDKRPITSRLRNKPRSHITLYRQTNYQPQLRNQPLQKPALKPPSNLQEKPPNHQITPFPSTGQPVHTSPPKTTGQLDRTSSVRDQLHLTSKTNHQLHHTSKRSP